MRFLVFCRHGFEEVIDTLVKALQTVGVACDKEKAEEIASTAHLNGGVIVYQGMCAGSCVVTLYIGSYENACVVRDTIAEIGLEVDLEAPSGAIGDSRTIVSNKNRIVILHHNEAPIAMGQLLEKVSLYD
jgi:hypothetical protein